MKRCGGCALSARALTNRDRELTHTRAGIFMGKSQTRFSAGQRLRGKELVQKRVGVFVTECAPYRSCAAL
jgi:hypothetical protein